MHLEQLTDSVGVFEHASGSRPLREHGYCTDDVARAIVVVLRESARPVRLRRLESVYLEFLAAAQLADGRFHNRRSAAPGNPWLDDVGSDDAGGRALWALGVASASASTKRLRRRALSQFERGSGFESPWPRANADALLGAAAVLRVMPRHARARGLIERGLPVLGARVLDPDWPWPERRLAYDNARLPEARIAAGIALGDRSTMLDGLDLLAWLVGMETHGDHFSFTPVGGWAPGEPRPGFDQQPIEAGAIADACARAYAATGHDVWAGAVQRAAAWFLGSNDTGLPLRDEISGGCSDGLARNGRSDNQGAESTVAMISALQHARSLPLHAAARRALRSAPVATVPTPT